MHIRPLPSVLATTISLVLLGAAAGAVPAAADGAAEPTYSLTIQADPPATDYDHRTTDVSGVLTASDGTSAANRQVTLSDSLILESWNPWSDPIDPYEYLGRSLGTVTTDAQGRFTLPGVPIDNVDNLGLLASLHTAEIDAEWDPDNNPNTNNSAFDRVYIDAPAKPTTLTYAVDKHVVRKNDTLTVTGKVGRPDGLGPVAGARVYLRAYWESQYDAQAVTDASGAFTIRYKVRDFDDQFTLLTAPDDYYLAGQEATLPVHQPAAVDYRALSASVDRNGLATVHASVSPDCGTRAAKTKLSLQFAKEGSNTWRTVGSATVAADGVFTAKYKGGNGRYRWTHAETDACAAGTSATRAVHRTETRIVGFHGTPQPVRKGHSLRLNGTIQYLSGHTWKHRGSHPVEIWFRPLGGKTWVRTAVVSSNSGGAFQKTVKASKDGWWKAVQVGDASSTYTSVSSWDLIDVR